MKKAMWCAIVVAVLVGGFSSAQTATVPIAEPTATPVSAVGVNGALDSEAIARAFLSHEVVSYNGWLNFLRVPVSGGAQWVSGSFLMTKDGWITSLVIDGTTVPLLDGKPFAGLPINQIGSTTQFSVN